MKRLTPLERNQLIIELVNYDTYKKFQGGEEFHDKILTLVQDYNIAASKLDAIEAGPGEEESSADWVNSLLEAIFSDPGHIKIIDPAQLLHCDINKSSGRYPYRSW